MTKLLNNLPHVLTGTGGLMLTLGGAIVLADAASVGGAGLGFVQVVSGATLIVLAIVER